MGSNGYEIRVQLLEMAKEMLFSQWQAQEHVRSTTPPSDDYDDVPADMLYRMRRPPSPEDIQALAMDLYKFVQRKDGGVAPSDGPAVQPDFYGGP